MITQRMDSKIEYRVYCENCRAEFMTENPKKTCPVCENKEKVQEPKKEKGADKNDRQVKRKHSPDSRKNRSSL